MSSILNTYNRKKISFTKGKGSFLYSKNGQKYLDFIQGIAVNCLGHANNYATVLDPTENIISFSVSVENNNTPISGAIVNILQKDKVISTGTTIRGKCQVYIENSFKFTIKVESEGYSPVTKEIQKIDQSETITIQINK